jgi:hypothetical protein
MEIHKENSGKTADLEIWRQGRAYCRLKTTMNEFLTSFVCPYLSSPPFLQTAAHAKQYLHPKN